MIKQCSCAKWLWRICLHCLTIWTQKLPATCGLGFFFIFYFLLLPYLAKFWHLPATVADKQPSIWAPVVFRYISAGWSTCLPGWLVLAGDNHLKKFISSLVHSVLRVNEDVTITTYQQQGLGGNHWGGGGLVTFLLDVTTRTLLVSDMFWSWAVVSIYQCWWPLGVDLQ